MSTAGSIRSVTTPLRVTLGALVALTVLTACSVQVSDLESGASARPATSSGSATPDPNLSPVALSCPESFPILPWRPSGPSRQLAPTTPTQVVLCDYAPGFHLSTTLTVGLPVPDPIALAALLNDARPVPDDAVFNCPLDTGGITVVLFAEGTAVTTVEVARTGCRFATSSMASGGFRPSETAWAALDSLDPAMRPHTALQKVSPAPNP